MSARHNVAPQSVLLLPGDHLLRGPYLSGDLEPEAGVLHPSGLCLLDAALLPQEHRRLLLVTPLGLMVVSVTRVVTRVVTRREDTSVQGEVKWR